MSALAGGGIVCGAGTPTGQERLIRARARADATALAVLVLAAVAFHRAELVSGHLIAGPRTLAESYPLAVQLSRALEGGDATLANPFCELGESLADVPAAQAAYPPAVASLRLASPARALAWLRIVHHAALLCGVFLLARRLRLRRASALLAAIACGFSGAVVGRFDDLPALCALAYLPALALVALEPPGARRVLVSSALLAWCVLAGSPATALVLAACFALRARAAASTAATLALALALAAVALAPQAASARAPLASALAPATAAPASSGSVSAGPASLATLVVPFALGSSRPAVLAQPSPGGAPRVLAWLGLTAGPGPWSAPGAFAGSILYVGLVPLLALLTLRRGRGPGVRLFPPAAVAVALAACFVPPLAALRPGLIAALTLHLALALARRIDDDLASPPDPLSEQRAARLARGLALLGLALCALAPALAPASPTAPRRAELAPLDPWAQLAGQCAFTALWASALALALRRLHERRRARALPRTTAVLALAALAFVDQAALFAHRAWDRTPPAAANENHRETLAALIEHVDRVEDPLVFLHLPPDPHLDRVRALIPPDRPGVRLARGGRISVLERLRVLGPRAGLPPLAHLRLAGVTHVASTAALDTARFPRIGWLPLAGHPLSVHRVTPPPPPATILRALPAATPDSIPISLPGEPPRPAIPLAIAAESVTPTTSRSTTTELRVALRAPAFLVLPRGARSGFAATVDGARAPLADAAGLAAVSLTPGEHTVRLDLAPPGVTEGRALSIFALLFWLIAGALHALRVHCLSCRTSHPSSRRSPTPS